jgi:hypothetical protein
MFRRIFRSTIVLAALIGAYQAYARWAVPAMEPPLEVREQRRISRDEANRAAQSGSHYQLLLRNYFPENHWSQARAPKVIASADEHAMLVLDDYTRHDDGEVDIARFAFLIFPTPPREGVLPPRDTIILEAPQGAKLQFDNFRPERGQIGQITKGSFPGPITIRSDMREAGPDDDLLIETSDLEMNTKLLYTLAPVRFRMGANVGGGRELEIRFLANEHAKKNDAGLRMAGLDSLEIRRDVRFRFELNADSLLPGHDKERAKKDQAGAASGPEPGNEKKPNAPQPPVDVTCSGPFTFDFVRYVASVDRDVELRRLNPDGPSDQLTCTQLDLHFAPREVPASRNEPIVTDPGKRQQRDLPRLEPATIVAQGHPVVVVSPAHEAEARGDRIQIALREQRVRIDGGSESLLVFSENVLRGPMIDYQHPSRDSGTTIGRFRATGPGSLHYVPDPTKPQQVFRAVWQTSVQLGREKGQPVLAMEGRPQLGIVDMGSLTADQIRVYLRELQGDGKTGISLSRGSDSSRKLNVVPDRVAAVGQVEIHSPRLTGHTGVLRATFRIQPQNAAADATKKDGGGIANLAPGGQSQQAFNIDADEIRLDAFLQGQSVIPSTLACDGNVVLREVPSTQTDQQPLEIRGAQILVDQLDSKTPHITLKGANAAGPANGSEGSGGASNKLPGPPLALFGGRNVMVQGNLVEMDGRENRLWSDGPGKATLMVTKALSGGQAAAPFPVDIIWQGGLKFDGRTIVFDRDVIVAAMDGTLKCARLSARLLTPIQVGQRVDQASIALSDIMCEGQVTIDNVSRDTAGVTSHERMELLNLTVNQQTGAISGQGPGIIRSTRFGNGLATLVAQQPAGAARVVAPSAARSGSKLNFLRINFHRGLSGNLYTRELTFSERVQAVYGPVDSWEQELDLSQPQSLPPDSIILTCDDLRLNEDSIAAQSANPTAAPNVAGGRPVGPVQMQARGNVQIAGQVPNQGDFTIQANRASYEQAKDAFILEGDGRTPARLWRRTKPGSNSPPIEASKIRYVRSTGDVKADVQYFEFSPGDIENARRPKAGNNSR